VCLCNKMDFVQGASMLASPDVGVSVWGVVCVCVCNTMDVAQAASVLASPDSGVCVCVCVFVCVCVCVWNELLV